MRSCVLWTAGETLAGASERRLQALISKRGKRSNNATAELDASFKAAQEATVSAYASPWSVYTLQSLLYAEMHQGLRQQEAYSRLRSFVFCFYRAFLKLPGLRAHQAPVAHLPKQTGTRKQKKVHSQNHGSKVTPL